MASGTTATFPSTSPLDLVRLAGRLVGDYVRSPGSFDLSDSLRHWIKATSARLNSQDFIVNLVVTRLLLVTGSELSHHIMAQTPDEASFIESPNKVNAMSFLAPQALTISHGERWQRLRQYNEAVLDTNRHSARQQVILDQVHQVFAEPVSNVSDLRNRMGTLMLGVVFGEGKAPDHLAEDIQVLFGYVTSPLRRILLGWRERRRRERFYNTLLELWRTRTGADAPCLLTSAHGAASGGRHTNEELLNQIPHWMFTFTGSGTDLLSRTLALVSSRPRVQDRILAEIEATGDIKVASTIDGLHYLEACLLETCRLFPPVTRALHVSPHGNSVGGVTVPAGVEILHYFPIGYRDTQSDPTANSFQAERWLDTGHSAELSYPNLFLSGPRQCPGRDLILFICKAALAVMLTRHQLGIESPKLAVDPLPFSFPSKDVQVGG